MSNLIVDINHLSSKNDKIFFGEYSGFQRFDKPAFPVAVKLEEAMRNAFWNPNEISMKDDAVKFHQMPAPVKTAMEKIWTYQTLMDSAQNRGLEETIAGFVTNPEFEALFTTWAYFEMIHSISYSHIIRGIYASSVDVFEKNLEDKDIINRIRTEIESYSDIATKVEELESSKAATPENAKKIIELILTIYALEGIKFYASFLMTYQVHSRYASIPGATRIIKLINFDEDLHTLASRSLLGELTEDELFGGLITSPWFADTAQSVFTRVLQDEKSFAEHLISTMGEHTVISKEVMFKFLETYVDRRLADIGVPTMFNHESEGVPPIVQWFDDEKDMSKINAALQESDMAVYNIGVMKDDF